MIGHELGGRYQIIERIGGGGMALVYKAHDVLLNRNVAIKVLRQQFVNDEEFIRRFRREAQSAASLSHPNVVSVYDVGQEDDIHYIVMEYVEGQNLNEIIKERAPLQVDEAIRIASQIADALDHAHHNQIIHRDIKPHNILIGRNGRVKVTDFGIARAVTSTTITQTGSVVGSVHYFSPEHAKGVATGEKSDLYSLGIVLYQMLTGRLPFLGESPISVALKHLQEHFEEPRSVNPMIPQSVENIILKSMRKNPGERYQSAKEMLVDLETCLLPERRMESKLVFDDGDDEDSTRIVPAIRPQMGGSAARGGSKLSRESQADEDRDEAKKGTSFWSKPVLWVSLTVLLLVAMAGVVWYVNKTFTVPDVTVPSVLNLNEADATKALQDKGLAVGDVKREYKEGFDEGIVYDQSRPEGTIVKEGAIIDLTVSIAKPLKNMPSFSGMTYEEAEAQLVQAGVDKDRISQAEEFSDEEEAGKIIGQSPDAGTEYDPESVSITLKVSKGAKEFSMKNLIGMKQEEAEALIKELGLKLAKDGIKTEPSFEREAGEVIDQWPFAPNSLATPGTEMVLTVSSGYPPEAIKYTFEVPAAPVEEGKNSKIRIVYGDARGDNREWGTKTINATQTFSVELVLAPNKNGAVSVIRDGELFDTYLVSYIDAKQGTVPVPQLPGSQYDENSYNEWDEGEIENPETGRIDQGAVAQAVKADKNNKGDKGNNGKGKGKGKKEHGNN
ncbi:Stk1 family PASTA domain-containing Ser/Thr kinase [Paenibacillus woosongensis]|uniref:Serine/threonine-protein kinase PrkC n=1 Tax=Paenibacillus woosongensis TaxID=307580 RepID=A0AA95I868_9BACL|nr:Stk1 family PASTA domain-containing Ser/Thr kinase [Paenibacillus woosongensis]WHX47540.1 Stk1 family PASTA domain-containing Ser/Thr kinase [Paenibacillus woosongensis]